MESIQGYLYLLFKMTICSGFKYSEMEGLELYFLDILSLSID